MAETDDDVDVIKVEDWEVDLTSEPEETNHRSALDRNAKAGASRKICVNLEGGRRQALDYSLIEEVKKYPLLYNLQHPNNRDTFLKERTWTQIGQVLNVRPEYCKLRWKSIRDRFVKTEKQERVNRAKGVWRASKPYRFASHLGFIRDHMRDTTGTKKKKGAQNTSIDNDDDVAFQDSPSDRENADDSSMSDYGWAPTHAASPTPHHVPATRKPLLVNSQSPSHGSPSNGFPHTARREQTTQELPAEDSIPRYYDMPSPVGHQPSSSNMSAPHSHPLPLGHLGARDAPVEVDQGMDEVSYFLMSLAPALRRLPPEKQSLARIKMQTILHEMEFNI